MLIVPLEPEYFIIHSHVLVDFITLPCQNLSLFLRVTGCAKTLICMSSNVFHKPVQT